MATIMDRIDAERLCAGNGARADNDDNATIDACFEAVDLCKDRLQALAAQMNDQSAKAEILSAADMLDDVIHDHVAPSRSCLGTAA